MKEDAFGTYRSVYLVPGTQHHIDAFALIDQLGEYEGLIQAKQRLASRLDLDRIHSFIDEIPHVEDDLNIIGPAQQKLYHTLLQMRAEKIFG